MITYSSATLTNIRDGTDATGLKDSIPFYLASDKETGITIYDEGWSTARPALDATNKYLWVYYLSRYSDGTTDPELIEVSGDIATFENNGDVSPIYNTEVEINPIQDLNGFDHAWNGGDGKNLLVYPYSTGDTYISHGITFTIEKYPNGAVKDILINGTASATTYFNLSTWASGSSAKTDLSKYTGQSLIISGGTNNARISVQYRLPNSTSNKTLVNDAGTGATFTVPDASDLGTWAIFISISNGTVLNNVRVYPMLRLATETDGTYEPYENICPINGWDGVKIERTGKNLLGIKYPNRTNNGITFTVNGSEIIANGTATANAWSSANLSGITSNLQYKNLIPPGQYMLTGGKSTDKKVYLTGNYLDGKSITVVNDYGNGALYTLTDWAYIYPQLQINNGQVVENEVFNLQLELATTGTDYEPYCGNTYEIDFPTEARTIFKGKLVIDENGDGQLIQTHKSIILNNTNRNGYNLYSPNIRPYWIIDDKALFSSYIEANNHIYTDSCIISHSGVINSPQNAKVQTLSAYTTKVVYVILINMTTQEAMDAYLADHPIQLVYELAEPIIYHLTAKQILAVLKTNHIYANTGNTTVKYYDNQKVTEPYIDYSATSAFEYSAEALDKIDNLEIGGRNLLRMSSMSSQDASISNSNTDFTEYFRRYNGNASQHIFEKIADGVYQDTIALNTNGNLGVAFGRLVSEFNFDYNSEYTLSCWAKCTKENAHLDIGLSYYKNNDTWEWRGGTNPQDFKEINKWQFFKLTFKPDADTKAICYCFTVKGETNGTDSFTIRNCKLEKGNKPTDWTPAPEDVEEEVSTLRTDLQSQIDEKIQTFYQSTNPASSWTTTELRTPHDGDLWYYTGTTTSTYIKDNVYRYNASNNTWSVYSASGELFDKVDGKSTIYYGTTSDSYTGVETGDYLVDSTDGSSYRWNGSEWVKVTDYQTTITNAIDNIQIGSRNLALDSSLTGNIQKWNPTADRWIKTIKDGHECLMCEGSLNTTATLTVPLTINSESYGVVPYNGLQLVFSADVLLEDVVKGTTNFYLALYASGQTIDGNWRGATLVKNSPHMTGASIISNELNGIGWTRVWYIFKYDDYNWTNYLRPAFYARDFTGRVYVKNIKVEYGDYATSWTPAPEDTQADIDTALAQSVEYIIGTQTAATGTWTGKTVDKELKVGKTIAYKLPYSGSGNASLVLTLADNTTTNAIAVYLNTTRVTTHFGAGSVINMTYDGQYWRASSIPNSNTVGVYGGAFTAGTNGVRGYSLIMRDTQNTWVSITTSAGSNSTNAGNGTNHAKYTGGLYFDTVMYEGSNANYASGASIGTCYTALAIDLRYSTNCGSTLIKGRDVYLVGTITNGLFYLDNTWWTQTIPTSQNDKVYIYLGSAYSTTSIYLVENNPAYMYYEGKFLTLEEIETEKAKKTATNYMSSDNTGIMVADLADGEQLPKNATGKNVFITAGYGEGSSAVDAGVHIRNGQEDLASFGETAIIGKENNVHLQIGSTGIYGQNSNNSNDRFFEISQNNGVETIESRQEISEDFSRNNTVTKQFTIKLSENKIDDKIKYLTIVFDKRTHLSLYDITGEFSISNLPQIISISPSSGSYSGTITISEKDENNNLLGTIVLQQKDVDLSLECSSRIYYSKLYTTPSFTFGSRIIDSKYGGYSTVNGLSNIASGNYSYAGGKETIAEGDSSFAMGNASEARENYSVAIGDHVIAKGNNQTVIGCYNKEDDESLFVIGNGVDIPFLQRRSNALTVDQTGNIFMHLSGSSTPSPSSDTTDGLLYSAIAALGWETDIITIN